MVVATTTATFPAAPDYYYYYYYKHYHVTIILLSYMVHLCIRPVPAGSGCLGSSGNDASDPPHSVTLTGNIMIGARR